MEDVRPPHKVTDYSSSSEESGTTDEEDDDAEQEGAEEPTSGPEDTRAASVPLSVREDECPRGLPRGLGGKEPACQCRRCGFDPWVGKILGEGNGDPLQYFCLESPMDRGAWWATVHGVAQSQTRLSMHSRVSPPRAFFPVGTRCLTLSSDPVKWSVSLWWSEPVCLPFFWLLCVCMSVPLSRTPGVSFSLFNLRL